MYRALQGLSLLSVILLLAGAASGLEGQKLPGPATGERPPIRTVPGPPPGGTIPPRDIGNPTKKAIGGCPEGRNCSDEDKTPDQDKTQAKKKIKKKSKTVP
jgi:hypothetical protein